MKINKERLMLYFLIFPFLYPRGFLEIYPLYKGVMNLWCGIAMVCMILIYLKKSRTKEVMVDKCIPYVFMYFITMMVETMAIQKGIGEGLQKMFATPVLFMFMLSSFNEYGKNIIDIMGNILLINFTLSITIFNPISFRNTYYVAEQVCFLGHIQVCTEMALLAMTIAYFQVILSKVKKAKLLYVLSFVVMIVSGTEAGIIVIIFLLLMYIVSFSRIKKNVAELSQRLLLWIGTCVQGLLVLAVVYFQVDFGARYFVFADALIKLKGHLIAGYGVYGVLIHVFWHDWENVAGMNYAHNEVLQILLDGGVILIIFYLLMCSKLLRGKNALNDYNNMYWFNIILIAFLMVGACESVTDYNYFYFFLILNYFLPSFKSNFKTDRSIIIQEGN